MGRAERKPERIQSKEVAEILGLCRKAVNLKAGRGEIPSAALIGSVWTFDRASIARFKSRPKPPPRPDPVPMIYFVMCGSRVKIGHTTKHISDRIRQLQTGNHEELQLLMTLPGTKQDEAALHVEFAELRIRGEWFRYGKPIRAWMRKRRFIVRPEVGLVDDKG